MIKVNVKKSNGKIYEIVIKGHANYDVNGKDIVCAAVSSIAITTINAISCLDESIDYEEKAGLLKIRTLKDTLVNQKLKKSLIILRKATIKTPLNISVSLTLFFMFFNI